MNTKSWRGTYIELCESVFRELGFDPPAMLHDDNLPLAMEIEVDERNFELLHSSVDRPHQILILCQLDNSAENIGRSELSSMLSKNLDNIRRFLPYYGINSDTQAVVSISTAALGDLQANTLLEKLKSIAQDALFWREQLGTSPSDARGVKADSQGVMLA